MSHEPKAPDVDPAVVALARARTAARAAAGGGPGRGGSRVSRGEVRSGPAADARDPKPLGTSIQLWIAEHGLQTNLTVGGLTERWSEIAGGAVAEHVRAEEYRASPNGKGGTLVLVADSPGWAVEIRYLVPVLLDRIASHLGPGLVTDVEIRQAGRRGRAGGWSVRSGRRKPRPPSGR